jgi:hypothetical protein
MSKTLELPTAEPTLCRLGTPTRNNRDPGAKHSRKNPPRGMDRSGSRATRYAPCKFRPWACRAIRLIYG